MSSVKQIAFEMGVANCCRYHLKKASNIRQNLMDRASAMLDAPSEHGYSADAETSRIISKFMENESAGSLIQKIRRDPYLTPEEKQKLIDNILKWREEYKKKDNTGLQRGRVAGAAGGLALSYLLSRKIQNPWLRALLIGTTALTSGIIGGIVGDKLTSDYYSAEPRNITYSKWKGF